MAWFEFHQSLVTHRKLYALAGKLGVSRPTAAGHLAFLWAWALDNAPNGNLSKVDPHVIKLAADWPKKAELFHAALVEAGFIDPDGFLHDWWMYAGRLAEQREKDAERKRMSRRQAADSPAEQREKDAERKRMSRRQAADSPADGGQTAVVDNQPNRTEPNTTKSSLSAGARNARDWFESLAHRTPNAVLREILLNIDASHPPECIRFVFEKSADKDNPWRWAKIVFDTCLIEGHEPRATAKERRNGRDADSGAGSGRRSVRQGDGRNLPASQRVPGAGTDWAAVAAEHERIIAAADRGDPGLPAPKVGEDV